MEEIEKAAKIIKAGGLVAFPTETVYGLGADATNQEAALNIFKSKGRPSNNPLIVHVASITQAESIAVFNDDAYILSEFWPGPLSLVLTAKKEANLAPCVTAGLDSVAIRIPANKIALELLRISNKPIAAPSANKSGYLSPTSHIHVEHNFGKEIFILESNEICNFGLESTIVDLTTSVPTILRYGFITPEIIAKKLDKVVEIASKSSPVKAPGMLYKHYSPHTKIRINAEKLKNGEVGLNFGDSKLNSPHNLNLSKDGNLAEAAANLFDHLHKLDEFAIANNIEMIAVAPIPNESIGLAINDRLSRACN